MELAKGYNRLENDVASIVALNRLVIRNTREAIGLQTACFRAYTRMGLDNLDATLEVHGAEGLFDYAERQRDMAREFTARVVADTRDFLELNRRFLEEAYTLAGAGTEVSNVDEDDGRTSQRADDPGNGIPGVHDECPAHRDLAKVQDTHESPKSAAIDPVALYAPDARTLKQAGQARAPHTKGSAEDRISFHPYPRELEENIRLEDGTVLLLRPVRPEDEPAFQDLFAHLSEDAVQLRFFSPKKELSQPMAAMMTRVDYDREIALVLAEPGPPGKAAVHAVVHLITVSGDIRAEFAIMVRSDMTGRGLGSLLMDRIIAYGKARGLKEIFGRVLRANTRMLKVCKRFGFAREQDRDDPGVVEVRLGICSGSIEPGCQHPIANSQSHRPG